MPSATRGPRRHQARLHDNIKGITKPAIRRLCRRAGVKRINSLVYDETRKIVEGWLDEAVEKSMHYMEHARRKTVSVMDVAHALDQMKNKFYPSSN